MLKVWLVILEVVVVIIEWLVDWWVLMIWLGDRVEFFDGLKVWVIWLEVRLGVERVVRRVVKFIDRYVKKGECILVCFCVCE